MAGVIYLTDVQGYIPYYSALLGLEFSILPSSLVLRNISISFIAYCDYQSSTTGQTKYKDPQTFETFSLSIQHLDFQLEDVFFATSMGPPRQSPEHSVTKGRSIVAELKIPVIMSKQSQMLQGQHPSQPRHPSYSRITDKIWSSQVRYLHLNMHLLRHLEAGSLGQLAGTKFSQR